MTTQKRKLLSLACCKLYISSSTTPTIPPLLASHHPQVPLLHLFNDPQYNRVGLTLVGQASPPSSAPSPLQLAVLDVVQASLELIDLRHHSGLHPRLGVVDHICFHPLAAASMPTVASLAVSVARDIGSCLQVPTFLYGAAHHEGRPLDTIRRALGYFNSDSEGRWVGFSSKPFPSSPDFGPLQPSPKSGVVIVGACPWIANYNIPILSNDLKFCRQLARRVSTRGGGLPGVQAMALQHGKDVVEIACNLLDTKITSAESVQGLVTELAKKEGVRVQEGYFTDYSEAEITEMATGSVH